VGVEESQTETQGRSVVTSTFAWGLCMVNWSGLGSGLWAGRNAQGDRAAGTGLPCVANHEQYFGYDIEECVDDKPWCVRNPLDDFFDTIARGAAANPLNPLAFLAEG
jgi:hypothetical protein